MKLPVLLALLIAGCRIDQGEYGCCKFTHFTPDGLVEGSCIKDTHIDECEDFTYWDDLGFENTMSFYNLDYECEKPVCDTYWHYLNDIGWDD